MLYYAEPPFRRESHRSNLKLKTLLTATPKKNFKKDFLNSQEESESSRSEEHQKYRSEKSRIEFKTLSALPKQLLRKESLLEEAVLCSTQEEFFLKSKEPTQSKTLESTLSKKPLLFPAKPSQTMQASKASPPSRRSMKALTLISVSMLAKENLLISSQEASSTLLKW